MPGVQVYTLPGISLCRHTALTQKARYHNSISIHEGDEPYTPLWGSRPAGGRGKQLKPKPALPCPLRHPPAPKGGIWGTP